MKLFGLMLKNMRRNFVRSALTVGGTMVLVLVMTCVWSILVFLDEATAEKSKNLKAIVTERWQIPSQMPFAYADSLSEGAARKPGDVRPTDSMTWQFYGGTLDKKVVTMESMLFAFAMEPAKVTTMMDDLDTLPAGQKAELEAALRKMEEDRRGIIVGRERLKMMNKRVGDKFTLHGINYRDIDLEVVVVGTFPEGRYDKSTVMNRDYLNAALDRYKREKGTPHPLAEKTLNLVWVRVPDRESFEKISNQVLNSPEYRAPSVKIETASSGIAAFIASYRDIIWGMRRLLAPAIWLTLALIISNAISIGVRERRKELAVLKVLGFRPWQIIYLVLGEGLLLGTIAGFVSAAGTLAFVNYYYGGIPFPIAFFPAFFVPMAALWWGPMVGGSAAFVGSVIPAWNACRVKVTDVFARVT